MNCRGAWIVREDPGDDIAEDGGPVIPVTEGPRGEVREGSSLEGDG
jgi:hypothetical protein